MAKKIKVPLSREELYKIEERNFLSQVQGAKEPEIVAKQTGKKQEQDTPNKQHR